MPVYNAASTLEATLDSLRAQTLSDFELVAVDDGSEDASPEILDAWRDRMPQLRPLRRPHAGLIETLNAGAAACLGQYIARMDADDVAHPERLARQVELLANNPSVSVASCLIETFGEGGVGPGMKIYEEWLNSLVTEADIGRDIFIESPIPHPSAVVRRAELAEFGGYQDHGWPEDYDLWLRYFVAGRRFAKVPQVLLSWREHPQRLTHTDSRYSVENFLRAKAHYLLRGPARERERIVVWGAGKTGRRLSKHLLRNGGRITAFVDIAANKIGRTMRGAPIVGAAELPGIWRAGPRPILLVAVASRGARALIRAELDKLRLVEGDDYWCVA